MARKLFGMRVPQVLACVAAVLIGQAAWGAEVIPGPYVALPITDMAQSGLQFTVLQPDRTMTNFIFYNQGRPDFIQFYDATDNILIEQLTTTPGYTEHFFRVDWPLIQGHTYYLTSVLHNNGRWTDFSDFPVANDDIRVDGVIDAQRNLHTDIWVSFRFLVTVPAPGALAAFAAAVALAPARRRRDD
jgi:hypothetical protein